MKEGFTLFGLFSNTNNSHCICFVNYFEGEIYINPDI